MCLLNNFKIYFLDELLTANTRVSVVKNITCGPIESNNNNNRNHDNNNNNNKNNNNNNSNNNNEGIIYNDDVKTKHLDSTEQEHQKTDFSDQMASERIIGKDTPEQKKAKYTNNNNNNHNHIHTNQNNNDYSNHNGHSHNDDYSSYNDLFLPSLKYLSKFSECLSNMYKLNQQCPVFSGIQRCPSFGSDLLSFDLI